MQKLYIIDGNAYIHRAYHAIPPLRTSKGEMVNAVYGLIRMLLKIMRSEKPEYLIVCFDHPAPTFRHKAFADYKAQRKETDAELKSQFPLAHEAVRVLNLPMIEKSGFEADDLIATLAKQAEKDNVETVIITGDKDILQIVNSNIKVWNEQRGVIYDKDKVLEKYGLDPDQLVDMFALMGDASDNIPGIKGIGEKTAQKLIKKYITLEKLLDAEDLPEGKVKELIKNGREDAVNSKKLLTLCSDVELDFNWADCRVKAPEKQKIIDFMSKLEFTSLLKEIIQEQKAPDDPGTIIDGFRVQTVLTENYLKELISKVMEKRKISLDLETTSLDPLNASLVGISIALDKDDAFYIPVGHSYDGVMAQLSLKETLELLKSIFENNEILKYGHNIKYDMLVLRRYGVKLAGVYYDSMIASYCLNPSSNSHGLKKVALEYLGTSMTEITELIGKGSKQVTIDKIDIEKVAQYAGADAVMVLRLEEKFKKIIVENKLEKLLFEIEMPVVTVLAEMEWQGIKVDVKYLEKLSIKFAEAIEKLKLIIFEISGEAFNLNSPKQLSVILFEKFKLPVVKKTKTGFSTDEEVLISLSSKHELPAKLLEYRELQKLKSTYIDSILKLHDPVTGRVHTSFNQAVTATGRLSSSDPNLQNIPVKSDYGKEIKRSFVAENGFVFISADYSQIDLRVLAHISGDEALLSSFGRGEDIHLATAAEVFGVEESKVTPELRRIAKTINFGIVYGISAYGLAQQLGITNGDAKEYIEKYFNRYSGVKKWLEKIVSDAKETGRVSTLLGRIRLIPEINSPNGQVRSFAERIATNTPIQGTSADLIKVAMVNISKRICRDSLPARMLVQVHDELLFEVDVNEIESIVPVIKTEMENAIKLRVPVVVDIKKGQNWVDMIKMKL